MTNTDAPNRLALQAAIAALPALTGLQPGATLSARNNRLVLRGSLDGQHVVIKIGAGRFQAARAERQNAALGLLYPRMHGGPCRVPRPVACHPDHGLGITSWVPGLALDPALLHGPARADMVKRIGAWFATACHDRRTGAGIATRHWVKRLTVLRNRVAADATTRLADSVLVRMQALARGCGGLPATRAFTQGDFRLRNLLVDGPAAQVIWGIDFDEWEDRPVARDMACMLLDLAQRAPGGSDWWGVSYADMQALSAGGAIPLAEAEHLVPFFLLVETVQALLRFAGTGAVPPMLATRAETMAG
jgi:hypothetical protein